MKYTISFHNSLSVQTTCQLRSHVASEAKRGNCTEAELRRVSEVVKGQTFSTQAAAKQYHYRPTSWGNSDFINGYILVNIFFVRFKVLTAASMKFRIVFWDVLP
jgi:hypothetical protein